LEMAPGVKSAGFLVAGIALSWSFMIVGYIRQ